MSRVAAGFNRSFYSQLSLMTLTFVFLGWVGVASSQAHTSLVSSKPTAEEVVSQMPQQVTLIFGEPLQQVGNGKVNQVSVVDSSGTLINSGSMVISQNSIIQPIRSTKNVGVVRVNFRVSATDGHVLESSFTFYNEKNSTSSSQTSTNPGSSNSETNTLLTHDHENSSTTQKRIYATSTILVLVGAVWGVWYYRRSTRKLN
jgi:methionine-rich copper-binding protein CopC